jgi:hypothetical protein
MSSAMARSCRIVESAPYLVEGECQTAVSIMSFDFWTWLRPKIVR